MIITQSIVGFKMKLWRLIFWTNSRRFRYVPMSNICSRIISSSCLVDHKVENSQDESFEWSGNTRSWWRPRVHGIALASITLLLCSDSNRECV